MTNTLDVTDADLGVWISYHDHPSFNHVLLETLRLAQRHGFTFNDEDLFENSVHSILSPDDNSLQGDFLFLVTDAVDYLNSLDVVTSGYLFVLESGSLILSRWL